MRSKGLRVAAALLLMLGLGTPVDAAGAQLRLGETDFQWLDSEQEVARFTWSAIVTNSASDRIEVEVFMDLLDDDDRVIHTDSLRGAVTANGDTRVQHRGSLPFEKAVDVASFRFRVEPVPTQ